MRVAAALSLPALALGSSDAAGAGAGAVVWDGVAAALKAELDSKAFPGCTAYASVGDGSSSSNSGSGSGSSEWSGAFGHLTYGDDTTGSSSSSSSSSSSGSNSSGAASASASSPVPVSLDTTRYDMASLTKVLSTTSCVMLLYQRGLLALDDLLDFARNTRLCDVGNRATVSKAFTAREHHSN